MSNKPILFYSPKCTHSINLWKSLKKNNLLSKIIKINVNNTQSIPKNITSTPTLLINNRPPIIGKGIELYLHSSNISSTTSNQSTSNQTTPNQSTSKQPHSVKSTNAGGIQDYMPGEMSGAWSDNYSFIDNNNPISHSFEWLNSNNSINTSQQSSVQNSKSKNSVLDQRLELLKKKRTMDLPNNKSL